MIDLPITVQTRDGDVTRHDLPLLTPPDQWPVEDAKEVLWAMQRASGRCVLFSLRVVAVETSLGTAVTPAVQLSALALVWLQGAAFELPRHPQAH